MKLRFVLYHDCPKCGHPLVRRGDQATPDEDYLGCSLWPKCQYREALPNA